MTSLVWKLFNWLFGSCVFASLSARLDNRSKALEANLGVSVSFSLPRHPDSAPVAGTGDPE